MAEKEEREAFAAEDPETSEKTDVEGHTFQREDDPQSFQREEDEPDVEGHTFNDPESFV